MRLSYFGLSMAALALVANAASAQVNYNVRSYRVVLDQATVNSLTGNPTPAVNRFGVAVDTASNTLYAFGQQATAPNQDRLISVNLNTLSASLLNGNLDGEAAVSSFPTNFNISSRYVGFDGGRLLAASQNGGTLTALLEVNPATGVLTDLNIGNDSHPIVGFVSLGGNQYALQEGSFSGGTGELRLVTIGNAAGPSIEVTANAQGIARNAAGDLFVIAQTGTGAATIKRIQNVTSTPVITDVTPTSTAWTSENMTNTRSFAIANEDFFVYKRGASTATDARLYIVQGTNVITLTGADIAAGISALPNFSGSTFDIQDTHGLAVVPVSATQVRAYFAARSVAGGWAIAELTFGTGAPPAGVTDWALFE